MTKRIAALTLLAVAICAYAAAGPLITLHGMKVGIRERDSEKLSEYIDFPTLRMNLKEQVNAFVMKEAATQMKDNTFAALGMAVASTFAESLVESVESAVTPAGLANLMEGKKPLASTPVPTAVTDIPASAKTELIEPFKNARYTYDSFERFSVWVKDEKGEEFRFVLTRNGLSWKLTNIIIPMRG